jgi:hypothetical protein
MTKTRNRTHELSELSRPARRRSSLARWFGYLPEGLMVLLGVMLAFLMDDYREERERGQLAAAAMQRVELEVASNFAEVIAMNAITRERLAKLDALEPDANATVAFIRLIPKFTGYAFLQADRSAWSGMQLGSYFDKVPPDFVSDVFPIYDWNEVLKSLDGTVRDLVFGADVHDPSRTAIAWGVSRMIMEQQLIWSDEAIPAYCGFLQEWAPDLYEQRQDEVRCVMGQPMPTFREACTGKGPDAVPRRQ